MEKNAPCNDDDSDNWITLLAHTRNVAVWLKAREQKAEHSKGKPDAGNGDEKKGAKHSRAIDQELREEIALRK